MSDNCEKYKSIRLFLECGTFWIETKINNYTAKDLNNSTKS